MKIFLNTRSFYISCLAFLFPSYPSLQAGDPVIKVDLNQSGRQESEVNEPGYIPWPVTETTAESRTFGNVNISFSHIGSAGTSLVSDWYKAGIQSPILARLANDGMTVKDGNDGGQIEMRISGLPEGKHTLLTYHNTYSNPLTNTFSPIDIFINGTKVIDDLMPSNRINSNDEMPFAYMQLNSIPGEDIVILFSAETSSDANAKNVTISGFEINTANPDKIASKPDPADGNEHLVTSGGIYELSWVPAEDAVSHDLYIGTDPNAVDSSTRFSNLFAGNQVDTSYLLEDLYSMNTYYWRIDEIDGEGNISKGEIWYFRPAQLAFEGAGGYGRFARGGRGGKVVEVTNLNDSGEGSLRWAITNDIGPRTVIFRVSGIITLESRLTITQDYITVAGQTAPGKGICIRSAPFGLSGATDIIIRNIRVRLGSGETYDGMGMAGSDHSIIDHCSISWTIDEAFSSRNAKNISLQNTLISEALNVAGHNNYPPGTTHGYAASISGDTGSFHKNLIAHCYARNWSLAGGLDANGYFAGKLDIFNNVVYNWGARTTEGGAHKVNFVNNYYKPGPAFQGGTGYALYVDYENFPGTQQYYFAGNVMPGFFDESNQESGRKYMGIPQGYSPWVDEPFFSSHAEILSAGNAFRNVLSDVGCSQPVLDNHDQRIIKETLNGTYTYTGSVTGIPGIIDSEQDAGGWEEYPAEQRDESWDSDHDGLPDWWEDVHLLDRNSPAGDFSDSNGDPDRDGFTYLDDYLEWMAGPHFFVEAGKEAKIDLSKLSLGYADANYSLVNVEEGDVVISSGEKSARFISDVPGLTGFTFKVDDGEGNEMIRSVGILVMEWFPVSSSTEKITRELITIYPNPVSGTLKVMLTDAGNKALFTLFNAYGSALIKETHVLTGQENRVSLDLSHLLAGVYFLEVTTDNTKRTFRVVRK